MRSNDDHVLISKLNGWQEEKIGVVGFQKVRTRISTTLIVLLALLLSLPGPDQTFNRNPHFVGQSPFPVGKSGDQN